MRMRIISNMEDDSRPYGHVYERNLLTINYDSCLFGHLVCEFQH
jgi:hypothetical protein